MGTLRVLTKEQCSLSGGCKLSDQWRQDEITKLEHYRICSSNLADRILMSLNTLQLLQFFKLLPPEAIPSLPSSHMNYIVQRCRATSDTKPHGNLGQQKNINSRGELLQVPWTITGLWLESYLCFYDMGWKVVLHTNTKLMLSCLIWRTEHNFTKSRTFMLGAIWESFILFRTLVTEVTEAQNRTSALCVTNFRCKCQCGCG